MEKKNLIILVSAIAVIAAAAVLVSIVVDFGDFGGGGEKYDEITIEPPYVVSASDYNSNDGFRAADDSMLWVFDKSSGGKLEDGKSLDLNVTFGTDIPDSVKELIVDGAQAFTLKMAYVGEFPNAATLTYKIDSKYDGSTYTIYNVSGDVKSPLGKTVVSDGKLSVGLHQSLENTIFVFIQTPRVVFDYFVGGKASTDAFSGSSSIVQYGTKITINIVANEGYELVSASYCGKEEQFTDGATTATLEVTVQSDVVLTVVAKLINSPDTEPDEPA